MSVIVVIVVVVLSAVCSVMGFVCCGECSDVIEVCSVKGDLGIAVWR